MEEEEEEEAVRVSEDGVCTETWWGSNVTIACIKFSAFVG
jgi:hypothetical protein